jgi:hypothetical protein
MKNLMKSAEVIKHVFGLVIGNNFTTPSAETMERYPFITQVVANSY